MTLFNWLTLAGLCFLGALTPGPSMLVIARHTMANGRYYGLVASASHALGVGIFAMLALVGINTVLRLSPLIFQLLTLLGAFYLSWLGYQLLRSKQTPVSHQTAQSAHESLLSAIRDGLLIVLFNPKIALFFLALLSQFISPNLGWLDWGLLWAMISLIDGICYSMLTLLISQPHILEQLRQHELWINRASGLILLSISAHILLTI